ncbi:protein of unknown function DUF397 [Actinobacteria bacterium OK074]|nr:protein of unknown function DUF397 [Actinobacteria bacterium OK074]
MDLQWRKSSFSDDTDAGNCVEVARFGDDLLIRESDEPGAIVTTAPELLRTFLAGIKARAADRSV